MRGRQSPLFVMIEKDKLIKATEDFLAGSDQFLVKLNVGTDNNISIYIDGDSGVTIEDCVRLSRHLEQQLDRDQEDFGLNVSSPGVDEPFAHLRQYKKNIGRAVEIVMHDGSVRRGVLESADEAKIELAEEIIKKNKKSKKMITGDSVSIKMEDIARAKAIIIF